MESDDGDEEGSYSGEEYKGSRNHHQRGNFANSKRREMSAAPGYK